MPTNSNPYSRNRSDRQQPGAITLGKRGRLGRGAQVLPTAPAAEVSAARPSTTFRNAHPRPVPGQSRSFDDIRVECAPGAGQVEVSDLTGCAGLSKDESHGQTSGRSRCREGARLAWR